VSAINQSPTAVTKPAGGPEASAGSAPVRNRTAPAGAAQAVPRGRQLALMLLPAAQFMIIIDASIINVALPSIGTALHFSRTDLSWVVNAYTLTFGGFLLLGVGSRTCWDAAACSWAAWPCSHSPRSPAVSRPQTAG